MEEWREGWREGGREGGREEGREKRTCAAGVLVPLLHPEGLFVIALGRRDGVGDSVALLIFHGRGGLGQPEGGREGGNEGGEG